MKIKSLIAEGTMCPKLMCEDEFVNPITQELQMCEIAVCVTREQSMQIAKECPNYEQLLETLEEYARKELDDANTRFQYETIKKYALEHNSKAIVTEQPEKVFDYIQEITDSSESPKIVIDVRLIHEIREEIDARKTAGHTPEDTFKSFHLYCTVNINDKPIRLFTRSYATWAEKDCLVYDENNPKNSKLISYL